MPRQACAPRLLALALVFLSAPAWLAAEDGRVLIVLDGSNSMWGRVDGTEKIVVAREVLAGMLADLPPELAVGLAAYGHRREKDCDDIEVILPVATHSRAALDAAIRRVQPRGMTPITAALQRVVEQLDKAAGPTHVVLVSDGKETCAGDPCALVRALRARDATLTVHVVGFDVTREEAEQLACIAEAGGGLYAGASTAADLTRALGAIRESVVEAASAPEIRAGAPSAGRDAEEPYWRVETDKATYEGRYSVVHRLGEGLSIQLVNDDAVNVGLLMPVPGPGDVPVEHAFLSLGRGRPCHIVRTTPPFTITVGTADPMWLRGTFAGTLACADFSALVVKGEFAVPRPGEPR